MKTPKSCKPTHDYHEGTINFDVLLKDSNEPLYKGCRKYSKLSFMLKLYHINVCA